MNRLQKKCAFAVVGLHLLLLLILIVGPGFFAPKPKADNLQILDVIPANLIDAAFNSGVQNATPPPPTPVVTPPAPTPTPPAPTPVVTPTPTREETPEPVRPVVREPIPEPQHVEKPKIQINTQLVTRTAPKNSAANPTDDARRQQRLRQQAFQNAVRNLKANFKPGTVIDVPGNSSGPSYASYRNVLASVYYQAWEIPNDANADDETVLVSVTIARDGTVVSSRIITPSGNAAVDRSVQATLERVQFIAPFPDGMNEEQHTFQISFEPKTKKLIG